MGQVSACYKCGNSQSEWGKDPMHIVCNACYLAIENQQVVKIVSSQELCTTLSFYLVEKFIFVPHLFYCFSPN
jgi:NMD protein affecting ribosome stability and mRNA decay